LEINFDDDDGEDENEGNEGGVGHRRHESKPSFTSSISTVKGDGLAVDQVERFKRQSCSFLDMERGSLESIRD